MARPTLVGKYIPPYCLWYVLCRLRRRMSSLLSSGQLLRRPTHLVSFDHLVYPQVQFLLGTQKYIWNRQPPAAPSCAAAAPDTTATAATTPTTSTTMRHSFGATRPTLGVRDALSGAWNCDESVGYINALTPSPSKSTLHTKEVYLKSVRSSRGLSLIGEVLVRC